jgi:hypothetical protein
MSARSSSALDAGFEDVEQYEDVPKNVYIPHGLPTEGNGDLRTHYSGIKSYDEDMDVAELILRYNKNKSDFLTKKQLVCFYVQKAYNYLENITNFYKELSGGKSRPSMYTELERYLNPEFKNIERAREARLEEFAYLEDPNYEFEKPIPDYMFYNQGRYNNYSDGEKRFEKDYAKYLETVKASNKKTREDLIAHNRSYEDKLLMITAFENEQDLAKVYNLFEYIMDCNVVGRDNKSMTVFILPNIHGIYGICTYLYAYVNNVYLEAIPNRYTAYDQTRIESSEAGPCWFLTHDRGHSELLEHYRHYYGFYKENGLLKSKTLFYEILNNPKYGGTKEMLLLAYFDCLHELNFPIHKVPSEILDRVAKKSQILEMNQAYEVFDHFFVSDEERPPEHKEGLESIFYLYKMGWSDALKTVWLASERLQRENRDSRGLPSRFHKYFASVYLDLEASISALQVKRTSKDPKFTGYQLRHLCIMYFYEVLKEVLAAKFPPTDQTQKRRK